MCDGCFNRLSCEAVTRNAAMAKAKKELLLQIERDEKMGLLNGSSSSTNLSAKMSRSESAGAMSSTGDQIDDLKDVLAGTGEALKERGEKLATAAEKSAKMEEVCLSS